MSVHISLIDLSKKIQYEMDDELKKQICFGETLIISCCHSYGDIDEEETDSECSCSTITRKSKEPEEIKQEKITGSKPEENQNETEEIVDEQDDFHFYFFPDCSTPPPAHDSQASLILVNGIPKINPTRRSRNFCTCTINKDGNCECYVKLPCFCGAKSQTECTCSKLETICVCDDTKPPETLCTCRGSNICVCHPDKVRPICTCDQVEKPCMCHPEKFPYPVCICKTKPKYDDKCKDKSEFQIQDNADYKHTRNSGTENLLTEDSESIQAVEMKTFNGKTVAEVSQISILKVHDDEGDGEIEEHNIVLGIDIPCDCQKKEAERCYCVKGRTCVCQEQSCICGVRKTCICEPINDEIVSCKSKEPICKADDVSICSCPDVVQDCECDLKSLDICECFATQDCVCSDSKICKCTKICECTPPCICDTFPKKTDECLCLNKSAPGGDNCDASCSQIKNKKVENKLKKIKAKEHGYRWCHEVDPHHTFFDYGYGRHDKISYKEEQPEKIKITDLAVEMEEKVSESDEVKAPPYRKKIRKPSLDCCSAVGGISICVETLGQDKDKFLVQVVSHSTKEGCKTGSKLVSILDCNLHTLEENRSEYITKKDLTKERRSYAAICESGYYNKVSRICGERHIVKRFYHSFDEAKLFLLEGANIVLLRYLALRRWKGNFKTETVLMDGSICESVYVCLGVSQAIVNGKPFFVVKIERHVIEPSGRLSQTRTVLSLRGYTVSHEWADSNYTLHLNPLLNVTPEEDQIEPHPPLREKWREDLQLLSDYLDFKSSRSSEGALYVSENGDLTNTIKDYLQALLMLRPQDALNFTRHYFGTALSALDLPHDEYFDTCSRHVRYFFFED